MIATQVVASDINPSWEKGVVRNIQEFKTMADCCGPQIAAALSDPKTKSAIDALNAVRVRRPTSVAAMAWGSDASHHARPFLRRSTCVTKSGLTA